MCSQGARQACMNRRDLCFLQTLLLNSWVGAGAKMAGSEAGWGWRPPYFWASAQPVESTIIGKDKPKVLGMAENSLLDRSACFFSILVPWFPQQSYSASSSPYLPFLYSFFTFLLAVHSPGLTTTCPWEALLCVIGRIPWLRQSLTYRHL